MTKTIISHTSTSTKNKFQSSYRATALDTTTLTKLLSLFVERDENSCSAQLILAIV